MVDTTLTRSAPVARRAAAAAGIAYVAASAAGFGLYLAMCGWRGRSPWIEQDVRDNTTYMRVARVLPVINAVTWTYAGVRAQPAGTRQWTKRQAATIGAGWAAGSAGIDLAAFVLPRHRLALDSSSFYRDQAPWLQLSYLAIAAAPLLSTRAIVRMAARSRPCPDGHHCEGRT